ncbi:transcriptional regulator [Streptomyces sp. 891-h]|uniref:transcriptional regulator n=1 Tax=Streptomyces sp. 891-h TaxID=2720714 RepID=UPI001FA9AD77|nr:transcriptional regulator [Streptomyces sp. 891-h]UNZ18166.1 transcriptional regulator [Streptomyces sp. 891-h]
MSTTTGCNPKASTLASTAEDLAERLSTLLPDAATVRVRLTGPQTPWPHLRLDAIDGNGRPVPVTRAKALAIARWVIRSFPHAGWAETSHVFDLRTATLHGMEIR